MNFETLKKSHLKRNIIIGVVAVLVISAVILNFTRAKYRVTQSIPLVNGTINYSLADLNVVALYIDGTEADELDSSKQYTLDTSQSTCTYKDGSEIEGLSLSYDSETGQLNISPFTTKGTKCYLYFDTKPSAKDTLLAYYSDVQTRTSFSSTVTATTTGTIYKSANSSQYDDDGEVYYFAGNPTDNWVLFANKYWRIIRINGDGSIRLIYQGTSANTTGTDAQIQTSTFSINSSTYNNNAYVGYMYTIEQVHGTGTNSGIKTVLDTWYNDNIENEEKNLHYGQYLDGNAGFCGDRTPSTSSSSSNGSGGTSTTTTYYGGYIRRYGQSNGVPTYECPKEDLYTVEGSSNGNGALKYPIGLISMDEAWYAGGYSASNSGYYLYTGQNYWTMSPSYFNGSLAYVFRVSSDGYLGAGNVDWAGPGVRPVINLKADVQITGGEGTSSKPYVLS